MKTRFSQIKNPDVKAVFKSYPPKVRKKLMVLRQLILDTAASRDDVGKLEETLKWGEPSYLTPETKSGSTIRIDWKAKDPDYYAIYFKCTTDLVAMFKKRYPKEFVYGGNRSILFNLDDDILVDELSNCISLALTYHLNKKLSAKARWAMAENSLLVRDYKS